MKKKPIGKLNSIIYFEEAIENSYTKDDIGGYDTIWVPALGEISDIAEATTTTTNIKMTAHGMATGDYIINTSRSNNVKPVVYVDVDNVTVSAIIAQASGDIIKKRIYGLSKVWASINSKVYSDYYVEEQQKTPKATHIIEIRYRDDINTEMRIKFGSRYFEILSFINVDEADFRIKLQCREIL